MTRYESNLFANFAGSGMAALLQLAFIPFYIRFLGAEAYGLIGFHVMIQTIVQVLDFGLAPTMNREMARYSVSPQKAREARDFARTLETVYWTIGICAGAAIVAVSPLIATKWVNAGALPIPEIVRALTLMGGLAALQLPLAFYQGGLMGLQRQVLFNGIKIAMSIAGSGGAVLVLWLFSPTVTAFLGWQLAVAAMQAAALGWSLWHSLPADDHRPRFSPVLLKNVWRFAAGTGGIAFSTILLTQLDKILLSRLLPLKTFGYYALATAVGNGLYVLITPVFNATFPRITAMVAARDERGVRELYHLGSQLMAVLILPVASIVAFFSHDVLALWTGNAEAARNAAPVVSLLIAGTAMNGLMNLPYALQLAHGWTRLALSMNAVFIVAIIPAIFFLTSRYGAVGGASAWAMLNAASIAAGVPLTHRRLLRGEGSRWFLEDVAPPLAIAILVAAAGRLVLVGPMAPAVAASAILSLLVLSVGIAAFAAPGTRAWLISRGRTAFPGK